MFFKWFYIFPICCYYYFLLFVHTIGIVRSFCAQVCPGSSIKSFVIKKKTKKTQNQKHQPVWMASDYVVPINVQQRDQVLNYGAVAVCVCDTGICPVTSILN